MVLHPPSDFPHTPANHHNPSLLCNTRNTWIDANGPQLCLPLKVPAITPPYDFLNPYSKNNPSVSFILELAEEAILHFRGKLEEMLTLERYPDELRVTAIILTAQEARYCLDRCDLINFNAILFWAFVRDLLIQFPCVEGLGLKPIMESHDVPPTKDVAPGVTELRIRRRTDENSESSVIVYRGGERTSPPADEREDLSHRPRRREDRGERSHRSEKVERREKKEKSHKSKKSHSEK